MLLNYLHYFLFTFSKQLLQNLKNDLCGSCYMYGQCCPRKKVNILQKE